MEFEVDKEILLKSISINDSIISSKNINTILSNCLFNVTTNEIEIITTDNEINIKTSLDAISDMSDSFTVNGKNFYNLLKELPKGNVVVNINDSYTIDIKSKHLNAHYQLIGTSIDNYPEMITLHNKNLIEIDQSLLRYMIKKVIYAAAIDTLVPSFNGILFLSDAKGMITLVSSDSRRLSIITRSLDNDIEIEKGIIIPLKTINEIYKLLGTDGKCTFSLHDKQCFFSIGKTEIISKIIDDVFPNYKLVLPESSEVVVYIQTEKIIESIRRALVFTRGPAYRITLNLTKDVLTIKAKTPDLGEAEEDVFIESNIEDKLSIALNAQYFFDSIKEIDSSSIKLSITNQKNPIIISPENDSDYISVIMPFVIKNSNDNE